MGLWGGNGCLATPMYIGFSCLLLADRLLITPLHLPSGIFFFVPSGDTCWLSALSFRSLFAHPLL